MRDVIVNSTPMIILSKIGMLDILQKMYGNVIIPQAVFDEVTVKDDYACHTIKALDWINVRMTGECIKLNFTLVKLR